MTEATHHLTLPSPDGFDTTFGFDHFRYGRKGTSPAVRGPIAFLTTATDYEPVGASELWGVRVDRGTGADPAATTFSGGLYVWSEAQTGFVGAIRGAAVIAEVNADAGLTGSVGLNVQSNMRRAHTGAYSIALDVAARSYDPNVSSISGTPMAVEAEVAGYLDDDTGGGEGHRQAYNARCGNLDVANVLATPAFFGAAFRAVNGKRRSSSGVSWWKKAFHAVGGGPNGGIIDGFVADRVRDIGLHIISPGLAGILIRLGANPHTGEGAASAVRIEGGSGTAISLPSGQAIEWRRPDGSTVRLTHNPETDQLEVDGVALGGDRWPDAP